MAASAPVFIMSSERSGSNLLRTLLSNHPDIAGPTAPQFLNGFRQAVPLYEPLQREENAVALARALLAVANHPHYGWGLEVDPVSLVRGARVRDFLDLVDALYRAQAEREGGRRYICKENRLFDFMDELLARWPDAAVLYLVRDPRDYTLSWLGVPLLNDTPYQAARCWRDEQRRCLDVLARHGGRIGRVSYEDLISDPRGVMSGVLGILGEPLDEACFEVQGEKNQGQAWSSFWTNLTQPVRQDNSRKYRQAFDPRTLEMIETVCAAEMAALGYLPETPQRWRPGPLFDLRDRWHARRNDRRLRSAHAATVAVIHDRQQLLESLVAERRRALARG